MLGQYCKLNYCNYFSLTILFFQIRVKAWNQAVALIQFNTWYYPSTHVTKKNKRVPLCLYISNQFRNFRSYLSLKTKKKEEEEFLSFLLLRLYFFRFIFFVWILTYRDSGNLCYTWDSLVHSQMFKKKKKLEKNVQAWSFIFCTSFLYDSFVFVYLCF